MRIDPISDTSNTVSPHSDCWCASLLGRSHRYTPSPLRLWTWSSWPRPRRRSHGGQLPRESACASGPRPEWRLVHPGGYSPGPGSCPGLCGRALPPGSSSALHTNVSERQKKTHCSLLLPNDLSLFIYSPIISLNHILANWQTTLQFGFVWIRNRDLKFWQNSGL